MLVGAAGHTDAARNGAQGVGRDAEYAAVDAGAQQLSVGVEEAKADVADRAGRP